MLSHEIQLIMVWLVTGVNGYVGSNLRSLMPVGTLGVDLTLNQLELDDDRSFVANYGDSEYMAGIFNKYDVEGIVHLAAFKNAHESLENPQKYIENNFVNSINLFDTAKKYNCNKIIFASSAAVYGNSSLSIGLREDLDVSCENPYGESKKLVEQYLESNKEHFSYVALRFFNISGVGERGFSDSDGMNLIPLAIRLAKNKQIMNVYGSNFPTKDGTAIRDYVHVNDVIESILLSKKLLENESAHEVINIGSGQGTSVLEVIQMMKMIMNLDLKYEIKELSNQSSYCSIANIEKAKKLLGWLPKTNIRDILTSYQLL